MPGEVVESYAERMERFRKYFLAFITNEPINADSLVHAWRLYGEFNLARSRNNASDPAKVLDPIDLIILPALVNRTGIHPDILPQALLTFHLDTFLTSGEIGATNIFGNEVSEANMDTVKTVCKQMVEVVENSKLLNLMEEVRV